MTDPILQIYLPSFMLVFMWLTFFWSRMRKPTDQNYKFVEAEKSVQYDRVKRIDLWFKVIFWAFAAMVTIYSLFPKLYFFFVPFDVFHHPFINLMGLLILMVALAWVVVAQIFIDQEVYKYSRNMSDLSAMEMVYYSERRILSGLVILFVGVFVTITNLIGLVLGAVAFYLYRRTFILNHEGPA